LKLVWKRKRSNFLLTLEIFISFLVVFAVATMAASMIGRWRKPLGFDYQNVWMARIAFPPAAAMDEMSPEDRSVLNSLVRETRTFAEVESVAGDQLPPFGNGTWTSVLQHAGRTYLVTSDTVTDDFAKVMKLRVLNGRWFAAEDETATAEPIVIDADVARTMFGTLNVAGKTVSSGPDDSMRIVGVIAPYRKDGELSADSVNMVFHRLSLISAKGRVGRNMVLRVRPGTPADFEQTLIKRLHAIQPEYPVRIQHMDQQREVMIKMYMAPAIVGGTVALFLMIMVALGLSGVLWQNVTRRTRELGLRRALGATGGSVHRQIIAEVALLTTLAVIIGVLIVAQLPILGLFKFVTPSSYTIGIVGALATIYGLTLLCGLYPSWLAGRVQPAQALHYE
jgi:putative ABC transport system permease protein